MLQASFCILAQLARYLLFRFKIRFFFLKIQSPIPMNPFALIGRFRSGVRSSLTTAQWFCAFWAGIVQS